MSLNSMMAVSPIDHIFLNKDTLIIIQPKVKINNLIIYIYINIYLVQLIFRTSNHK